MSKIIATFFYSGYLKPAPGTWGSLAGMIAAYPLLLAFGQIGLVVAIGIAYALGHWATVQETTGRDNHDPSEIVIDEVVGIWIALLPVAAGAEMMGVGYGALYPGWIAAFGLFRLFDITKPWLVGWADRMDNATGVMLDDVIAGVFAALGVIAIAALYHVVWL